MTPIVSVVVPTKNRYKYLKGLISMIENFNDYRIELLVHDNSDNNAEMLDFLIGKSLVSTSYYYDSDKLSMGENAERGINKAKGEYICFIGDDDAVCRNIADCAEWMRENQIDAVRSLYLNYCWNEDKGDNRGSVYYDDISFACRLGDPIAEMKKVLNDGVPDFKYMAKIYHGIIKKSDDYIGIFTSANSGFYKGSSCSNISMTSGQNSLYYKIHSANNGSGGADSRYIPGYYYNTSDKVTLTPMVCTNAEATPTEIGYWLESAMNRDVGVMTIGGHEYFSNGIFCILNE